jgi:hypothetical protein
MKTYLGAEAPLPGNNSKPHVIDVVFHLGRTRRFGGWGNTRTFGVQGVHHALLHDAHEYVTGDIPSPVKACLGDGARLLENYLDNVIADTFAAARPGPEMHNRVKLVDQAALIIEAFYFGTAGSFHLIGRENWGKDVGKTAADRLIIRAIIENVCPEVIAAMNSLIPSQSQANGYEQAYS